MGAAPAPAMSGGTLIDITATPFLTDSFQCSGTLVRGLARLCAVTAANASGSWTVYALSADV